MSVALVKLDVFGKPVRSWDRLRTFRDEDAARVHLAELRRLGDRSVYLLGNERLVAPAEKSPEPPAPAPERLRGRSWSRDQNAKVLALLQQGITDTNHIAAQLGVTAIAVRRRLAILNRQGLLAAT